VLSRQPRDLTFRIEMFRLPAEFAPRPGAAQLLVERKTPRPFAEFGRDRVGGDDLWRLTRRAEAFRDQRDWTARKYAMWEAGEKLPSRKPNSLLTCPCGKIFDSHRLEETMVHVPHITATAR
jgi:hypothetical protein